MADNFPPTDDIAPTGNSYGYYDEHYADELQRLSQNYACLWTVKEIDEWMRLREATTPLKP